MPSDSEIRQLLCDDSLSDWFRMALLSALECNPEQAAHDAGLLSLVLDRRAQSIAAEQIAGKAIAHARGGSRAISKILEKPAPRPRSA